MTNKDYYKILNVSKDSSQEEIKKSYRKLSLETHPDKGGNEDHFKEISEAYQILSDPEKRKNYDMFGSENANRGFNGPEGFNPMDILNNIFGGGMNNPFQRQQQQQQQKPTKIIRLSAPLSIFIKGGTMHIEFIRKIKCEPCNGTGNKNKQSSICETCKGNKLVFGTKQVGPGIMIQTQVPCQSCNGLGKKLSIDNICSNCNGTSTVDNNVKKELIINPTLPAMFPKEQKIIELPNEGDYIPEINTVGDCVVVLDIDESSLTNTKISIPEGDIHIEFNLTLDQVLIGFKKIPFTLPSGEIIYLHSEKVLDPNTPFQITNEGLKLDTNPRGSVYIHWKVIYPKKFSNNQIYKLKKFFMIADDSSDEEEDNEIDSSVSQVKRRTININ